MRYKALALVPRIAHKDGNNIDVEIETLPLVLCKNCKHYNPQKKWCQHMEVANGGYWFCADGEVVE